MIETALFWPSLWLVMYYSWWSASFFIHSAGPQSQPVVITIFTLGLSIHLSSLFKSCKTKQVSSENNDRYWRVYGSGRGDHWWHLYCVCFGLFCIEIIALPSHPAPWKVQKHPCQSIFVSFPESSFFGVSPLERDFNFINCSQVLIAFPLLIAHLSWRGRIFFLISAAEIAQSYFRTLGYS